VAQHFKRCGDEAKNPIAPTRLKGAAVVLFLDPNQGGLTRAVGPRISTPFTSLESM
jgi:hypothetical protein